MGDNAARSEASAQGGVERALAWLIETDTATPFAIDGRPETRIGRVDLKRQIFPEIDLSVVDSERSVSRRHAVIRHEGGQRFVVIDHVGTMNGTYLNGFRLPSGKPTPLEEGDSLVFGLVHCRFSYERPRKEAHGARPAHQPKTASSETAPKAAALALPEARIAFGINENIDYKGCSYHAQTEDLGVVVGCVLSIVYSAGTILLSRKTPYSYYRERHGEGLTAAEMVRLQHRLIVAGVRRGRHLKKVTREGR